MERRRPLTDETHDMLESLHNDVARLAAFDGKTVQEVLDQVYFMNGALWNEFQAPLMVLRSLIDYLQGESDTIDPDKLHEQLTFAMSRLDMLRELVDVGKHYNHHIHQFLYSKAERE